MNSKENLQNSNTAPKKVRAKKAHLPLCLESIKLSSKRKASIETCDIENKVEFGKKIAEGGHSVVYKGT